jgi:hypothetical protein
MMAIVYVSLAMNVIVAGFWGIVLGIFPRERFRTWPRSPIATAGRMPDWEQSADKLKRTNSA